MTFLISKEKKATRTTNLAARYKTAKVANKLISQGMGKHFARIYSTEFTKLPEDVKVDRS